MKSEKVKEFIDGHVRIRSLSFTAADIQYCAMLAEREAEERMREKAIKAYCHDCSCAVEYICDIGADNCLALQGFIQKLNEE